MNNVVNGKIKKSSDAQGEPSVFPPLFQRQERQLENRRGVFDEKLRRGRYKSGNNRFEKPWKRRRAQPHKEKAA